MIANNILMKIFMQVLTTSEHLYTYSLSGQPSSPSGPSPTAIDISQPPPKRAPHSDSRTL